MNNKDNKFIINSKKFDGKIYRSWQADLIERTNVLYVFKGVFDTEINHAHLGVIRRDTISYEYFWTNRWYSIFKFHEPGGEMRNFYCNVNMPPTIGGNVLEYVDLDIDVLIWRDFSVEILDLEEFKINADRHKYPRQIRENVDASLKEILYLAKNRLFPFNLAK